MSQGVTTSYELNALRAIPVFIWYTTDYIVLNSPDETICCSHLIQPCLAYKMHDFSFLLGCIVSVAKLSPQIA